MGGDIAAGLGDPIAGARRAGQAHGLGQRLIDVARRQPLRRAAIARIGIGRGTIGRMHFDQAAELAAEIGPPAVLRAALAKLRPERIIFGDQVVQPDRLMRRGDDGRDRRLVLRAEPIDQQILEVAERDSAIDCAARGEGDDQGVGAAGETFGALRRILDPRQPLLRSSAIRASLDRVRMRRLRCLRTSSRRALASSTAWRLRRRDAENARRARIMRESPAAAPAPARISTRPISSLALQLIRSCRSFRGGLLHSRAARASRASSVGLSAAAIAAHPSPAASTTARLIARDRDRRFVRRKRAEAPRRAW